MTDQTVPPAPDAIPPSRPGTWIWRALYLVLVGLMAFGLVAGLRLRCEGFGCMGVGVYWFAWACGYGLAGLLGLFTRASRPHAGRMAGLVRGALWLQGLAGLGLLAYWQWPH